MPAAITEVDIEDWGTLIRIAKFGTKQTGGCSLVYPYLRDVLGVETLNRIKDYRSINDISDEEKALVLSAFNRQRLASSGLTEDSAITYDSGDRLSGVPLHIAGTKISEGFWVVSLLRELLSERVLTFAPDGRHLKIKADLTEKERLRVEWLHVGLMNFIYGNLLDKRPHPFARDLGGNWYFGRS
jgi:hypothetical protein